MPISCKIAKHGIQHVAFVCTGLKTALSYRTIATPPLKKNTEPIPRLVAFGTSNKYSVIVNYRQGPFCYEYKASGCSTVNRILTFILCHLSNKKGHTFSTSLRSGCFL